MLRFENTNIDLGIISPDGEHIIDYVMLEGSSADIGTINKSCSCIGTFEYIDNILRFNFKDGSSTKYAKDVIRSFPNYHIPVSQTITLYLNSPQPHTELNLNTGKMQYIDSVTNIKLTFSAKVDGSSLIV